MSELLEVNHVSYAYHSIDGETETLADISFHIKEGEFAAIVGPSGCGKSTLLSLICGLLKPEKGEILLDGAGFRGSSFKREGDYRAGGTCQLYAAERLSV